MFRIGEDTHDRTRESTDDCIGESARGCTDGSSRESTDDHTRECTDGSTRESTDDRTCGNTDHRVHDGTRREPLAEPEYGCGPRVDIISGPDIIRARMFKSLSIARFRGIKEGTVPDLRQVSLFVGPNNSGKSTILDALLLANSVYGHDDPLGRSSLQILAERHNLPPYEGSRPWPALWYAYDTSEEIEIGADLTDGIEITYRAESEQAGVLELNTPEHGWVDMAAEGFGEAGPNMFFGQLNRTRGHGSAGGRDFPVDSWRRYRLARTYLRDLVLIDSEFRRNTRVEQLLWPQLIGDRRDKLLTYMLREVYGMDVENLTYTPSMNGNELVILLPKYSVRVDDLGDGARYFVRMLMVLSLLKDTTLLLEEPETAHHCRAQADITRWIVRSAKERNLQVLATTHSLETVDHFLAACTESSVEFGLHHTELKDGVLTCRSVDRNDARVLMDMGVDPRCAP